MYDDIYFEQLPNTYEKFKQMIIDIITSYNYSSVIIYFYINFRGKLITLNVYPLRMKDLLWSKFRKPALIYNKRLNKLEIPLNVPDKTKYEKFIRLLYETCKLTGELTV